MSTSYTILPTGKEMKDYCQLSPDRLLPQQALALLVLFSIVFCILFSVPAVLVGCFSFVTGSGFWNGDAEALASWTHTTVFYGLAAAASVVALTVFIRTYVRSQFGRPSHVCEMEADLPRDTVMEICSAHLHGQAIEDTVKIEETRSRMTALVRETRFARTFVEVRTIVIDENSTRILVKSASVPYGKSSLLSAFYSDLGAAREAAMKVTRVVRPFASRRRRTTGQWSKQVVPVMKPSKYCPPPMAKAHQIR